MHNRVILYSGGMDSHMLAHAYPDALRLYIDVGSRYSAKEREYLPPGVTVDGSVHLGQWERPDAIIPCRNLFLALVGAQYGNDIMLGATAGDQSTDKDSHWAKLSSDVLHYMFTGKHFEGQGRDPQVLLPFKHLTKGQLVAEYLRNEGDPVALARTVSCYHPVHKHCGKCKSCLRKWVALEYNNIPSMDEAEYAAYPWHPEHWTEIIQKLNGGGWRTTTEDYQTVEVLRRHGIM